MPEAPSLFDEGCPDEEHTWSPPERLQGRTGVLTARWCLLCGLNHTTLSEVR